MHFDAPEPYPWLNPPHDREVPIEWRMKVQAYNYPPMSFRPLQTNIHMQLADFVYFCRRHEQYAEQMVDDDRYALTLILRQTEWLKTYVEKLEAESTRLQELDRALREYEEPSQ